MPRQIDLPKYSAAENAFFCPKLNHHLWLGYRSPRLFECAVDHFDQSFQRLLDPGQTASRASVANPITDPADSVHTLTAGLRGARHRTHEAKQKYRTWSRLPALARFLTQTTR